MCNIVDLANPSLEVVQYPKLFPPQVDLPNATVALGRKPEQSARNVYTFATVKPGRACNLKA